jgi:WD40 repeat protein
VWNADGHGEAVVLRGHADMVRAVAFSLDGRRIVTGSYDNTARVWSVDGAGNPVVLMVLTGHHGPILGVAFSSDGKLVATGSDDQTARVWPADGTGRAVVLSGHTSSVEVVAFDPSNQRVITVSAEDNLKIWSLSIQALEDELANANADCLLPEPRTLYLDESEAQAREGYAVCERQHGRVPSDQQSP